jgi:hypothetical protein
MIIFTDCVGWRFILVIALLSGWRLHSVRLIKPNVVGMELIQPGDIITINSVGRRK